MILFTADWHIKLGQKNVPVEWALNRYNTFFNQIHEISESCEMHIIGGDLFDRIPTMDELSLYFSFVRNVKKPTLIYDGNHEATRKNRTFLSQLKQATADINPLVNIMDISYIDKGTIFFGGSIYKKSENPNCSLRYKFGKKREEINSIQRNKNPYKYVSSRNFMCKKDVIVEALSKIESVSYGNDYVFGSILKRKRIDIFHFDNPVLIENIEENSIFIRKTHQALDNVIKCYKEGKLQKHSITLLKVYRILEVLLMKGVFIKLTNIFRDKIKQNLYKENPDLFLFDVYRLSYICKIN